MRGNPDLFVSATRFSNINLEQTSTYYHSHETSPTNIDRAMFIQSPWDRVQQLVRHPRLNHTSPSATSCSKEL
jgi:hypothetical protein